MRRGTTSFTALGVVSLAVASCASVIGLDQVDRVECAQDCGVEAGTDGTLGDGTDDGSGEGSMATCHPGERCDGGRCNDAGACQPGCSSSAECAAPNSVCDTASMVCVPCLPGSNTCPLGTICVPSGGEFACAPGCNTVADCAGLDAGDAGMVACCGNACTNTASDNNNCSACGQVCPGGAEATCQKSQCVYTIGGTLAGLPASDSIVLQDNGADDLTLSANGSFAFATPLAMSSAYLVTVKTTPNAETCAVMNGSGSVAGADVTSVQVTCKPCYVAGSQSFTYTGALQSFTVPCGVTSIGLSVNGASGAGDAAGNAAGGLGGAATGTLAVTQGQVLQINVGGAGSATTGGWNGGGAGGAGPSPTSGGGGGGASDVRVAPYALSNRVIVGGGGGGAGGERAAAIGPGAGGGGGGGYFGGGGGESYGGAGGGPGTQSNSGAAGCGSGCGAMLLGACGVAGVGAIGGAGAASPSNDQISSQVGALGGAGGGPSGATGAAGGPCASSLYAGGGGGGGSGYVGGVTGGVTTPGVYSGNGKVTITW